MILFILLLSLRRFTFPSHNCIFQRYLCRRRRRRPSGPLSVQLPLSLSLSLLRRICLRRRERNFGSKRASPDVRVGTTRKHKAIEISVIFGEREVDADGGERGTGRESQDRTGERKRRTAKRRPPAAPVRHRNGHCSLTGRSATNELASAAMATRMRDHATWGPLP